MFKGNLKVHWIKFVAGAALFSGMLLAPNSSLGAVPTNGAVLEKGTPDLSSLRLPEDLSMWFDSEDQLPWSSLLEERTPLPSRRHWPSDFEFYEPQRTFCSSELPKEPYTQRLLASCQVGLDMPRL